MTLIVLPASFDTLDHSILLARLREMFGISGRALEWFSSCLTEFSLYASMDGSLHKRSNTTGFLSVQTWSQYSLRCTFIRCLKGTFVSLCVRVRYVMPYYIRLCVFTFHAYRFERHTCITEGLGELEVH